MSSRKHEQGNPLIGETYGDTIENLIAKTEFLLMTVGVDDQLVHPAIALDILAMDGALKHLRKGSTST